MNNNKYVIKKITVWMIDELTVIGKHTNVDVILLNHPGEFYEEKVEALKSDKIKIHIQPFTYKNFGRKLGVVFKFLLANIFNFGANYNGVIGLKSIFWFMKLDLSLFSNEANIHAQFATQSSVISVLVKRYYNDHPSFYFTFHAYDIYFKNKWFNMLLKNCNNAFSISDYNIKYIEENYSSSQKLKLSRLGVFTKNFLQNESKENPEFTMGMMSWFVEKKGVKYLLNAMKIVKERGYDNIKLILAGDGPLKKDYLDQIAQNGLDQQVEYIGAIGGQEKVEFYHRLDVFTLPCIALENDQDGIPVVLMESIAYGIPMISTDVSGIPEICLNDYNGKLVTERDEMALVDAIIEMIEHPEEMLKYQKNAIELSKSYDIEINALDKIKQMHWI